MLDIQVGSATIDAVAVYEDDVRRIDADTEPRNVVVWRTNPETFSILDMRTVLGRGLLPVDVDSNGPQVAVISHDLWLNRFGGRGEAVGETIVLSWPGRPPIVLEVVGVLQPGFRPPLPGDQIAVHDSLPSAWTVFESSSGAFGRTRTVTAIGRLRTGASLEAAQAEMDTLSARLAETYPATNSGRTTTLTPLVDVIVGRDTERALWIFLGGVACILLIGVANLACLQTVRNAARAHEIQVRVALGAGTGRLVRQLVVDAVTISLVGGLIGLVAAWVGTRFILTLLPAGFPRVDEIGVDSTVLLFTMALSVATGVAFGLIPAIEAARIRAGAANGRPAPASVRSGRWLRSLIGVETGLALVLLIASALLGHSFFRLITQDAGMDEDNLWSVRIALPLRYQDSPAASDIVLRAMHDAIRELPQVEAAAVAGNFALFSGFDIRMGGLLPADSDADPRRDGLTISYRPIGPRYFGTVGMPVGRGRGILDTDTSGSERVAVINRSAARALWPGQDPIGKRFRMGNAMEWTVVGLVDDFRRSRLHGEIPPQVYASYLQERSLGGAEFMVRLSPGSGGTFADRLRELIAELEVDAEVTIAAMWDLRWELTAQDRFRAGVLLAFAATAVLLASVGVFGVVAYAVAQRSREIALRAALGAPDRDRVAMIFKQGIVPAILGLAIGFAASLVLVRLLANLLFELEPTDPPTIAAALGFLFVLVLVAAYVPARRAKRTDPALTLRQE